MPTEEAVDEEVAIEMLVQKMQSVKIDTLTKYPKNPRVGNLQAIKESITENGFFRPLIVQKSTNYVIGGNHSWQAARELGMTHVPVVYLDVDDQRAAKIVLADNRTNDLATYDADILAEIMKSIDTPIGTGYSQDDYLALVEAIEYHDHGVIEEVIRPSLTIQRPTEEGAAPTAAIKNPIVAGPSATTEDYDRVREQEDQADDEERGTIDTVDAKLQGILQLAQDQVFPSSNYYEIPDLLGGSALLDKLPTPMDTWAGAEATPDDGKTWWLWNYGVASRKGLPYDRAICCFYTYDTYFETWWDEPAFNTTKIINLGITSIVVPDFSFYAEMPTAIQISNTYRAQWLGRYFQEAGLKVIPRLQFSVSDGGKSLDFCMAGIPQNPPILAQSIQNVNDRQEFKQSMDNTKKALEALRPQQWLVYGSSRKTLEHISGIDPVGRGWVQEVVQLDNYAAKRRGVVFDKKEGLAGANQRKAEKNKRERDPHADDDDVADVMAQPTEKTRARRAKNAARQPSQEDPDDME